MKAPEPDGTLKLRPKLLSLLFGGRRPSKVNDGSSLVQNVRNENGRNFVLVTYYLEQVQQPDIDQGRLVTTVNANCSDAQTSTDVASNTTTVTLPGTSKLALGEADRTDEIMFSTVLAETTLSITAILLLEIGKRAACGFHSPRRVCEPPLVNALNCRPCGRRFLANESERCALLSV